MYVCTYAWMYVCMYVCVYIYIYHNYYITKHSHVYVQCHAYHIMSDVFQVKGNPSINWAKESGATLDNYNQQTCWCNQDCMEDVPLLSLEVF